MLIGVDAIKRRIDFIRTVLEDAKKRGDYYLEFDCIEEIYCLQEQLSNSQQEEE